jgi:hypothetical protein
MDPMQFDRLVRSLARPASRRATLAALVSGLLAGLPSTDNAAAKQHRKHRDRGKERHTTQGGKPAKDKPAKGKPAKDAGKRNDAKQPDRSGAATKGCCSGGNCAPGPGKNLTQCCYAERDLTRANFRGVNATKASFRGANLRNADFRGANLQEACLVEADIRGAKFGGANLQNVIRCRTQTDTGIDNSGCSKGTACCPTELGAPQPCTSVADCPDHACATKTCTQGQCVYTPVSSGPSPNTLCTFCCLGVCCQAPANQCNKTSGMCCAPNCAGRECGDDGCGNTGVCPPDNCPSGTTCNANGQCQSTSNCSAQNCPNGCCDDSGACQPGNALAACGTGGKPCATCDPDAGVCQQNGTCGTCTDICPCQGQSICSLDDNAACYQPGANEAVCGCMVSLTGEPICAGSHETSASNCTSDNDCKGYADGAVCVAAAPGSVFCPTNGNFCAAPCCTPQSCPNGCCNGLVGCVQVENQTAETCGTGGKFCRPCNPGQVCQNGQCTNCDPNCICGPGRDFCASGLPNVQCNGAGTEPCFCTFTVEDQPICAGKFETPARNCTRDADCQGFAPGAVCVPAALAGSDCPTDGNFCAAPCCNAQTCPNGCCSGGICVPGNTNAACGTGGQQCAPCEGQCMQCEQGTCQELSPNGAPCQQNSQCCSGSCSNGFCAGT